MTSTDLLDPHTPDPSPLDAGELRAVALRPHRALDLVLSGRARLARTIAGGDNTLLLAAILLCTSFVTSLPYGAVLGPERALRIAALTLGSVAICFPSLHVFGGYLGVRRGLGQSLGLALVVSAVAGVFTLSFAPIVWFIQLTTPGRSPVVATVSAALLGVSVLAGVFQLARASEESELASNAGGRAVMLAWVGLLLFVVYRMAEHLELV